MKKIKLQDKGITLIALVITIIVLLLLVGFSIVALTGNNGLLSKTKYAKEKHLKASAKERLELVLINLQTDKTTNTDYNENGFIDKKIQENKMFVNGDVVTVDGWQFKIDRSVPKIILSLGKGKESENIIVISTVDIASDYTKANIKLEISGDSKINIIKINEEKITVPEKTNEKYILEKEISQNGIYSIYVEDSKEEYKCEIVKVEGISEDTDVYTVEQLKEFRDRVNNGATYAGRTITLKNDLDLKDIEWIPIANYWVSDDNKVTFNGEFDGKNHTISNMKINITEQNYIDGYSIGFIGVLENGSLKNLNFNNPNVYTVNCVNNSIVVGNAYKDSIIENIKVLNGELSSNSPETGAICGALQKYQGTSGSIIKNCFNNASINSQNYNTGGIAGFNEESTIENCYNMGEVYTSLNYIGGICGCNGGTNAIVKNCYNTGTIKVDGNPSYVGGIIGLSNCGSTIENCYNIGDVIGKYSQVGGIVGHTGAKNQEVKNIKNVFNAGTIKKGTIEATADIGTSSNYLGTLIGYGVYNKTINGKYGNITIEDMQSWDNDTIVQNLGNEFKKNTNSNVNQGLPILFWQ